MTRISRRSFPRTTAAGGAVALSGAAGVLWPAGDAPARSRTRVYVLVVDGCRPDEITAAATPRLHALRQAGRWLPQA